MVYVIRRCNVPDTEQFTSSRSESNVGARKVVDGGFGKHGVVLEFGLAQRGAVTSDQDKLGYFIFEKTST